MKIVVLTGSPHKNGASNLLADRFVAGAEEAGHEVLRFDCAGAAVHPCIACDACRRNEGACVFSDDMAQLMPRLMEADAVVFASPVYYFGLSAQLKTVIDRFYGSNSALMGGKRTALLLASGGEYDRNLEGVVLQFEIMAEYMQWENIGVIYADACSSRADAEKTDAPARAYQLGQRAAK